MLRVFSVLKSGGEYLPRHVYALQRGVERHLPGVEFVCLSDVPLECNRSPILYDWPGWWSKMNLFAPHLHGDILFFDLDTVVTGSLLEIASVDRLTLLRNFYRDGVGSGMMFLPKEDRKEAWNAWIADPEGHIERAGKGGDQAFLETIWMEKAARWQDLVPGQVVSYKVHVRADHQHKREIGDGKPPKGTRVVCHHGNPRPWAVPLWQGVY